MGRGPERDRPRISGLLADVMLNQGGRLWQVATYRRHWFMPALASPLSLHATTQIDPVPRFLDVRIGVKEQGGGRVVAEVSPTGSQ